VLAAARRDSKRGPVSKAEAPELAARKPTQKTPAVKPDAPQIPERPVYASPPPKAAVDEGRRFVLITALFGSAFATGMTLLGTTVVVWVLALARFMFPNVLTEPPSQFKVGFSDDFAPGQVETKFKAQFGIWVVNSEYQGEQCIYALSTVCTHLGCTPNWLDSEQKFKCPCHGSGFYKDGINFEGPAPRPLERYSIRLASDGQLEVDKSRKFQEEMGQWQDPASFVPV
jgi:cytochrome b6-f complex iron-sulfur subunit